MVKTALLLLAGTDPEDPLGRNRSIRARASKRYALEQKDEDNQVEEASSATAASSRGLFCSRVVIFHREPVFLLVSALSLRVDSGKLLEFPGRF